jgi:MFS family permease
MLQREQGCGDKEHQCSDQLEANLQRIFNTSFIALSVMSTIFGLAVDRIGPRFTVLCGIAMSITGNVLFAFADWEKFNAFVWGYAFIAGGGIAPFLCHFNFANFYENQVAYISAVNTMFNVAGFVYLLISVLNLNRKEFFLMYAGICGIFGIAVSLLYPDDVAKKACVYKSPLQNCFKRDADSEPVADTEDQEDLIEKNLNDENEKLDLKGYWIQIKPGLTSRNFIYLAIWYSLNLLVTGWISGTLPDVLKHFTDRVTLSDGSDLYVDHLLPIISNLAFLVAPLSGYFIQKFGCCALMLVTSIFSSCLLLSSIAPQSFTIHFQVVSLLLVSLQKGCLFNAFYVYLGKQFDIRINGGLIAVGTISAAIIGTLSYGFTALSVNQFSGSVTYPNLIMFALTLPMLILPVILLRSNSSN